MLVAKFVKWYFKLIVIAFLVTAFTYYLFNSRNPNRHILKAAPKNVHNQKNFMVENRREITSAFSKIGDFNAQKIYRYGHRTSDIIIAVVLCGERLTETIVCLKSVLVFSRKKIHFIVIADDNNRDRVKNELLKWPTDVLERLSFEIHPISFPDGPSGEEWKNLFKLCAAQRLFLPSILSGIEALIYVDSDVLFIHPVEELWNNFLKMNNSHIAALSPEHEEFATGWYNRFARHPYYMPLGVNSGVMLMNLTRMRSFEWESYLPGIMKQYKTNIVWGDQDVINIIFHFHPDKLLIIPCEWNYRPDHCMYSSICKTAQSNGIGAIHGNRGVFKNSRQPAFKTVYEHMLKFVIGDDVKSNLIVPLKNSLHKGATNCGKHLFHIISSDKQLGVIAGQH